MEAGEGENWSRTPRPSHSLPLNGIVGLAFRLEEQQFWESAAKEGARKERTGTLEVLYQSKCDFAEAPNTHCLTFNNWLKIDPIKFMRQTHCLPLSGLPLTLHLGHCPCLPFICANLTGHLLCLLVIHVMRPSNQETDDIHRHGLTKYAESYDLK